MCPGGASFARPGRVRPFFQATQGFEFLRVPVYGDAGEARGLAGVAWDMSERFEAEERQRLITHFFDHASDAVLILDKERRVLTLNQAVTTMSGYELADMQGRLPRFIVEVPVVHVTQ